MRGLRGGGARPLSVPGPRGEAAPPPRKQRRRERPGGAGPGEGRRGPGREGRRGLGGARSGGAVVGGARAELGLGPSGPAQNWAGTLALAGLPGPAGVWPRGVHSPYPSAVPPPPGWPGPASRPLTSRPGPGGPASAVWAAHPETPGSPLGPLSRRRGRRSGLRFPIDPELGDEPGRVLPPPPQRPPLLTCALDAGRSQLCRHPVAQGREGRPGPRGGPSVTAGRPPLRHPPLHRVCGGRAPPGAAWAPLSSPPHIRAVGGPPARSLLVASSVEMRVSGEGPRGTPPQLNGGWWGVSGTPPWGR